MTLSIAKRAMRLLFGASAAAWLLGAGTVFAVEGILPSPAAGDQPITVFTGNPAAMAPGGDAENLVRYVRSQGEARVIVGLRIVTRIESSLSTTEVFLQRQAQRRVEDSILGRVFGSLAASRVERYEFIPYMAVIVDADEVSRLLADPQVVSVKKELVFEPALAETISLIHADTLFVNPRHVQGTGYVVAIIDSGVSKTTPMLVGKIVSEACYSTNNAALSYSSTCPSGASSSVAVGSAVNCPLNMPNCDHGTHVASIAAGNSSVYDGVARDSKIIAIKVATRISSAPSCTPTPCLAILEGDVILALKRVFALRAAFKIAAVNLSLSTRQTLFASQCDATNGNLTAAFASLRGADIATVVASGNNSSPNSVGIPACITSAIAVGNTQKDDLIWRTSNHSPLVDLMAPGTAVTAGVPPGAPCIKAGGGPYCVKTGTSMAAPHVAGAFALLKSSKTHPSANAILQALKCSGKVVFQQRTAGAPADIDPARWRIDLLGAYNYLAGPIGVLRAWGFAKKTELTDWTVVEGPWRFNAAAPGTYEVGPIPASANGTPLLTAVANCHRAFTVEIRFKRVDTQPFLTASGFWIKSVIDYKDHLISGYYFAFDKDKNPSTQVPGRAYVTRTKNFAYREPLGCTPAHACASASVCVPKYVPISQTGFNTIKIVTTGKNHVYSVNGTQICSFDDTTFASGAIVPYAKVLPPFEAGQIFQIDSLKLTSKDIAAAAAPAIVDPVMDPSALAPLSDASTVAFDARQ